MAKLFTPEELEELARADAELDETFCQTQEERVASRKRDRDAMLDKKDPAARKIAENKRAYYEANREKIAENQRAWMKKNREKWNAYQRERYKKKKEAQGCLKESE